MKNVIAVVGMVLLAVESIGCYKQAALEKAVVPAEIKVIGLDDPAPSQDEADIIISTHIKKASYLFSPRTAETPYTFTLSIDSQEIREDVKGIEEVESDANMEKGKGVHYVFKKRLRLKPGRHEIALNTEKLSPKVRIKLAGGKIHDLKFEPVYGRKYGLWGTFGQGLRGYKAYLEGKEIQ